MPATTIGLDGVSSILFVGNSFTFGRVDPVMSYNTDEVRDLTAPVPGTTFENTTGSNSFEPHPWGGIPGIFKEFADQVGLTLDVAISTRNAGSLQGHYLNTNPAGWDLRGNVASRSWDTLVLQDNSTQALPSGAATITFAAGSSTARLILTPTADTKTEGGTPASGDPAGLETVGVRVAAGTGYTVGTSSTLTGTIRDGTPSMGNPSLPTVTLVASPAGVLEDGPSNLVYTFTRTGPATDPLRIDFTAFRDGSTSPSVMNDVELPAFRYQSGGANTTGSIQFGGNTGFIIIPAGQTSATITVDPRPDIDVETDESIRLTLRPTATNPAYNVGTEGSVQITIVNDDGLTGGGLPSITGRLANGTVYEDAGGNLIWEFTRTGPTTEALTVNLGVDGTATLPGGDFTVSGADMFRTGGAENPDLAAFQTYAVKLAQYATAGAADGAIPANTNANTATDVFLYETWARARDIVGALRTETSEVDGSIETFPISSPEYYTSLEDMTADLRAAYEGLGAANPIFEGVAPVGAAFLSAVQQGIAIRDPFTETAGDSVGDISLWWDDNFHPSKYGSYLSALTLFGTLTGVDPRSLGAGDRAASELGIDSDVAVALQRVAAATVGFSLEAHWTGPGQVTELQGSATATLASAGAFNFSDSDTTAIHTVGAAALTTGARGTLTAELHADTTGDGTGGAVNWTYTADSAAFDYLVAGQTRIERFLVTLSDQNGGQVQREIAVTVNGVNDGTEGRDNTLVGNDGDDVLYGLGGNDRLDGRGGNDALYGGDGNDVLLGGDGNDVLDGGHGSDRASGGAGDDTFVVTDLNDGQDDYDGGAGSDTVDFSAVTRSIDLQLNGSAKRSSGDNLTSVENVIGGSGSDNLTGNNADNVLTGNAGNDRLTGHSGNDELLGGLGRDILDGGAGNDALTGGAGDDTLIGGGGSDKFVFLSLGDGIDTIADFHTNGSGADQFVFDDALFSGFTGDDGFDLIGSGYLRVVSSKRHSEIMIDVDGGGDTFQTIAISETHLTNGTLADHLLLI